MLQDLVACHDAALNFNEHDLAAKLDQCPALMAGNGSGMRLEETQHFLVRNHLFAFQHPRARLGDDALTRGSTSLAWASRSLTCCPVCSPRVAITC